MNKLAAHFSRHLGSGPNRATNFRNCGKDTPGVNGGIGDRNPEHTYGFLRDGAVVRRHDELDDAVGEGRVKEVIGEEVLLKDEWGGGGVRIGRKTRCIGLSKRRERQKRS